MSMLVDEWEIPYRGYKIVRFRSGSSNWIIYNAIGHQVGESCQQAHQARSYIDKLLQGNK